MTTKENNPLVNIQAYVDGKTYLSIHNENSDCSNCAFKSTDDNDDVCFDAREFTKGSCASINFVEVEDQERNKLTVNKPTIKAAVLTSSHPP